MFRSCHPSKGPEAGDEGTRSLTSSQALHPTARNFIEISATNHFAFTTTGAYWRILPFGDPRKKARSIPYREETMIPVKNISAIAIAIVVTMAVSSSFKQATAQQKPSVTPLL